MKAKELSVRNGRFAGVRGIAGEISTISRAALNNKGGATGFLEARFSVNGVRVVSMQSTSNPLFVAAGDEIVLAGYIRNDLLEPVAWWNCTRHSGYSPRVWEFWPCLVGIAVLLLLVPVRAIHDSFISSQMLRMVAPLLLLAAFAWSAQGRRRATKAVQDMRSGKIPVL